MFDLIWAGFKNASGLEWIFRAIPTLAFTFTLFSWLHARSEKRSEAAKRKIAEDEIRETRRRGNAPFFRASHLHVPQGNERPNQIVDFGKEVDVKTILPGIVLSLSLANDGHEARNLNDDWESGEGLELCSTGLKRDPHHATGLSYKYDPAKHGQTKRIKISFETLDGVKDQHVYETRHGFCEFRRIDPA